MDYTSPSDELPPRIDIETPRLRLRWWHDSDLEPFAALNADSRVMEYFPEPLARSESDAVAARIRTHFNAHGFGLWAVEIPGVTPFAGFVGLAVPRFEAHFTPCVEVGWRLATAYWGRGYATEAAHAALAHAFETLHLDEVVSMTAVENVRSRRVMEKIGMAYHPEDDFDHPLLPEGHPFTRHVLYRIQQNEAGATSNKPVAP
ncbi:MAG: GNAT family N-acetyltransferase [Bacteroidota bacterium]